MRVALLRPPVVCFPASLSSFGATPPLGLAYVAAALREAGHDVALHDAPGEAMDRWHGFDGPVGRLELHGLLPEELAARVHPDTEVVGVTHLFLHEWPVVRELLQALRRRLPRATLVLGGENATAFWPWLFRFTEALDFVVLGEGEQTIVELVAALARGEDPTALAGLAWRSGDGGASNGLAPRLRGIDSLPRPAWDLLPLEAYLAAPDNYGVHRGRALPVLATRGCPYRCTFCSAPGMWTTRYELRDPADLVHEIAGYVSEHAVQNINFADLTAVLKRPWILEFCRRLEAAQLGVSWQLPTGTRSEVLDAEVLDALRSSGCVNVTYNPESGSERVLAAMKKRASLPALLDSLGAAAQRGLHTRVAVITGHPSEGRRDVLASARLLLRAAAAGCEDASVMVFAPYPGSEDFARLIAEGLQVDESYFYLALVRSGRSLRTFHPRRGKGEIVATQLALMLLFYGVAYGTRPQRVLHRVRALVTGTESSPMDQLLRFKWRQLRTRRKPLTSSPRPWEEP